MFTDLREDEAKFFKYFCMSMKSFDELCVKVGGLVMLYQAPDSMKSYQLLYSLLSEANQNVCSKLSVQTSVFDAHFLQVFCNPK
jgi:hypothetical protein